MTAQRQSYLLQLVGAIGIAVTSANAMTTMTYDASVPTLFETINVMFDGQTRDIYAGQLGVRFNTGASGVLFCADPFVALRTDSVDVNRLSASTINQGGRLSWMYDSFAPTITQGWQAAAFQLAVWDIVSDSGDGFGNGRIQATAATPPGVLNTAISLVTSSQGKSSNSGSFYEPIAGAQFSQTLFSASFQPVPEPGSYALIGAGLSVLGLMRRRR
ncbi:MAG: PEP-CTERM sorting domain-containing protein [Acidobacteriaceae bacterium]|jgi:hypothetical protein|nr:PEP-CTERM sorting domain-containing protein [Acidobacteriaceae bacterium]